MNSTPIDDAMPQSKREHSFDHPVLAPDIQLIRDYFSRGLPATELRNPHPETPVSHSVRSNARSSAVLIPIIVSEKPTILVTKRQKHIRFGGHMCFPGGIKETGDVSMTATALRETTEEIGLDAQSVEVLGELGSYYSQAGFCITPVIGLVQPGYEVEANLEEVDTIHTVSMENVLNSAHYHLTWHTKDRGHFAFIENDVRIAGPTVSLMMGFYEALLGFKGLLPPA